jgi:Phage integrase, N-terminal SAM-like domain
MGPCIPARGDSWTTHGCTGEAAEGVTRYRGRYRVRVSYEGRTHSLGMFDTPADARAALDITRGQIARGRFVPPAERRSAREAEVAKVEAQSVTPKEWSEKWLVALEANPDRSPATVVSYRSVLKNHVLDDLGDIRLADLTTERVADRLAALGRQRSTRHPARVNGVAPNAVIVLRSMLNAAVTVDGAGVPELSRSGDVDHGQSDHTARALVVNVE